MYYIWQCRRTTNLATCIYHPTPNPNPNPRLSVPDQEYWYEQARAALRKRLQYATDRRPHAKNVLLFVGDGMGVSTATAARILRGQRLGKSGEEHELAWDSFPTVALAKVRAWHIYAYRSQMIGPWFGRVHRSKPQPPSANHSRCSAWLTTARYRNGLSAKFPKTIL